MKKALTKKPAIWHYKKGRKIEGAPEGVWGDLILSDRLQVRLQAQQGQCILEEKSLDAQSRRVECAAGRHHDPIAGRGQVEVPGIQAGGPGDGLSTSRPEPQNDLPETCERGRPRRQGTQPDHDAWNAGIGRERLQRCLKGLHTGAHGPWQQRHWEGASLSLAAFGDVPRKRKADPRGRQPPDTAGCVRQGEPGVADQV